MRLPNTIQLVHCLEDIGAAQAFQRRMKIDRALKRKVNTLYEAASRLVENVLEILELGEIRSKGCMYGGSQWWKAEKRSTKYTDPCNSRISLAACTYIGTALYFHPSCALTHQYLEFIFFKFVPAVTLGTSNLQLFAGLVLSWILFTDKLSNLGLFARIDCFFSKISSLFMLSIVGSFVAFFWRMDKVNWFLKLNVV